MVKDEKILVGGNKKFEANLLLEKANRHGLITGASGTGKTITSKVMAEGFSDLGVPVFMADVKGDLAGTAMIGEMTDSISDRVKELKLDDFEVKEYPVRFWDVYGKNGHPIRFRVSQVGPIILSIMLGLSEVQEGVLNIVFRVAEDEGLDLDNLEDLKKVLNYVGQNRSIYITTYGNITTQSIGVILRSLGVLENQGIDNFFGEPELEINDFKSFDNNGRGVINILDAVELYKNPDLYSSVMLCLLTELYNQMPEVGDIIVPKIVFFFDEAYFLFRDMPSYRLKQIEKVVRLIRSKGIGLYFISHYTTDIPDSIIDQLGNRVQHNLRAYTPAEQKIAKAAADSFRTNSSFNTYETILELGTGEAVVSFQNEKGEPEICERVTIVPPQSKIGIIDDMTRMRIINNSPIAGKYDDKVDDESASEKIDEISKAQEQEKAAAEQAKIDEKLAKEEEKRLKEEQKAEEKAAKEEEKRQKEELRAQEKAEKEAERAKKNNAGYKLGKKIMNKAENKIIDRTLNKVLGGIGRFFK